MHYKCRSRRSAPGAAPIALTLPVCDRLRLVRGEIVGRPKQLFVEVHSQGFLAVKVLRQSWVGNADLFVGCHKQIAGFDVFRTEISTDCSGSVKVMTFQITA